MTTTTPRRSAKRRSWIPYTVTGFVAVAVLGGGIAFAAGGGAPRNAVPLYRVPSLRVETTRLLDMPIRTSALRGLGATLNVWSIESVVDELAALAGAFMKYSGKEPETAGPGAGPATPF